MSNNMERENLLNDYLTEYTPENRMEFMKLVLKKYHFENYKISDNDIKYEDMIIQDKTIKNNVQEIINSGSCSIDQFKNIFNKLTLEQIYYIGF